ncbi:hypothetical protein DBR11_00155 [Pedobacter sp. HMWF019]|uniref:YdeI/OmpD-associated family protein n=1 Tax=Pedobacter sp. HMWF019 TaxID=2056856 RepID=UPI000D3A15E7|nr:YdeI/OmpD-associated family protein [Pedobacter sp. HMWF019]PTT04211.1 hypothetical protein DBR11_00155 [Pedobacter sp. HMWF019]
MDHALFKKLLVKPGHRLLLSHPPEDIQSILGAVPKTIELSYRDNHAYDTALAFVRFEEELSSCLETLSATLTPDTILWIAYPKKNSGITTDMNMMGPWDGVKKFNLSPCASVSINDVWTAIRLKPQDQIKPSGLANSSIKNNAYAEFIDIENKQVLLPKDLNKELEKHKEAYHFFMQLAWSHKKEYVLWILTAKQEKTRISRIQKMVELLIQKKKNPSDK